jgi:hypothetical protein
MCEQKGFIVSEISVAELKRDWRRSMVSFCQFVRAGDEWTVAVHYRFGPQSSAWLVDARDGQPRSFKSLDSAIRTVEACGVQVGDLGPASGL